MTRTKPLALAVYAILGAGVGWLLQTALAAAGRAIITPPFSLAFTLTAIGIIVIVLALPVRRAVRDRRTHRVDPFYATRVVVLAKASSIAGTLLAGAGIAIVAYMLTRTVAGGVGSIFTSVAAVIGAVALLACGLVAENMCSVPPDDDDKGDERRATARRP